MKVLRVINNKLEEVFLVILMALAVIIVSAQIVTRFILKTPLPWSEELARYMFIWLVWVGAAFATKERKHIRIDVVVSRLPQIGQKACAIISTIIWIGFTIFMVYISVILTSSVMTGGQTGTGSGIPMWIPYSAIPVGMALMLFRILQNCYYDLKALKGGKD
ncbi:MAG: TRAP transporter small permease [Bacillota bacterium]|nr:TRAP transporter small permease [Bacillota bacterium]